LRERVREAVEVEREEEGEGGVWQVREVSDRTIARVETPSKVQSWLLGVLPSTRKPLPVTVTLVPPRREPKVGDTETMPGS